MPEKDPIITQPVRVDDEALTQNVYADANGAADEASQGEFSQYVVDRMYGQDDEVAKKYKPGAEIPRRRLTFDGWWLKPKIAALATAVSLLGVNGIVNRDSIGKQVSQLVGDIKYDIDTPTRIVPNKDQHIKTVTTHQSYPIDTVGKEQRSGVAEKDELSARGLVRKLKAIKKGGQIVRIVITGNTSDEWTGDGIKSVGQPDTTNEKLGLERADKFRDSVEQAAKSEGVKLPEVKTSADEHVLHHTKLGELLADVQESKYGSVLGAISAYNRGDKTMPVSLRREIERLIGSKRVSTADVTIRQTVATPGKAINGSSHTEDIPRHDKNFPYEIIPFIIPPIPRTRRKYQDPFAKPPMVNEEPLDKVWIELYEEAQKSRGEVVDDAWALTRKYQYLYREERITQGLRYDYKDDDGQVQSINVLFIDRPELDEATIDAVSTLMFDISLIHGGKVADRLDTIAVLPSEHTGPQRPDKIGLGIDEQYGRSTLGVAIPLIGLVELQLPKKPTQSDIEKFDGIRWTLAHEVGGHFSDVDSSQARKIDRAKSNRPGHTYTSRNPWTEAGNDGYATTARRGQIAVQQFAIPHPGGKPKEYIVNPGEEELVSAESARLRGQGPTRYSDKNPAELHAETAAAVITNIPIPAREAGISPKTLGEKAGYSVDAGLQHRFVTHVGALANTDNLEWDPERAADRRASFRVKVLAGRLSINEDKEENKTSETAKNQPYQADEKRLKILSHTRR